MGNRFGELKYYSERGMVNAICQSIYQYKTAGFHFIQKIKDVEGKPLFKKELLKNIKSIQLFNEFSFGEFGDPDLILKINYKDIKNKSVESKLIFIEAKVGTYEKSAKWDCLKDTYENNASRINYQLRLKKRFVDALISTPKNETIIIGKSVMNDGERRLKKEYLVQYIRETIFDKVDNDIYYVAMTNDKNNPLKNNPNLPFEKEEKEFKYLLYITYNSFYGKEKYKPNEKSNEECVLFGDTYDMFKIAYKLTKNDKIKSAEENGEL